MAAIEKGRAESIELLVLDVDGVLTEGGIWVGETAEGTAVELKRFDIQDGLGIKLLQRAGIRVAIVSGRPSRATALRAAELGIDECHQDPGAHKRPVVQGILETHGLDWDQTAMMADDLADLPVLGRVGLAAAPADAVAEVRQAAHWVGERPGGRGAVREFAEALLRARGSWDRQVQEYCDERT